MEEQSKRRASFVSQNFLLIRIKLKLVLKYVRNCDLTQTVHFNLRLNVDRLSWMQCWHRHFVLVQLELPTLDWYFTSICSEFQFLFQSSSAQHCLSDHQIRADSHFPSESSVIESLVYLVWRGRMQKYAFRKMACYLGWSVWRQLWWTVLFQAESASSHIASDDFGFAFNSIMYASNAFD